MAKYDDIKNALAVSEKCYDAIKANIKEGVSEQDLYNVVKETIEKEAKEHGKEFIGDFVCGERTGDIGGDPTDKKMKMGDLFILDLSLKYDDYWCDTCRTFFLGEPTEEMRKAYATVLECQKVGEHTVKAGIVAQDVKTVMESYMVSQGFGGLMPHHGGHAVGEAPYQKPAFEEGCDMRINDGEVVTLEPGLYFKDKWGMRVENNYIVKGDHLEKIFNYTTDIEYFIIK